MERALVAQLMPTPASTYRIQFNPGFRFTDATAIVPYLDALGVGWLYASPYFRARPGSQHGYDVVDHNALNPEIGNETEHRAMIAALHARGMGHLLDFVPNHMGIGAENPWWRDVLALGPLSAYAHFFDIDWHARSTGRGKVVLPVLGDHYGRVVDRGELTVAFDRVTGTFALHYFEHAFPLAPSSYAGVLERAAAAAPDAVATTLLARSAAFVALRGRPREQAKRAGLRDRIAAEQRALADAAGDPELTAAVDAACAMYAQEPDRLDRLIAGQNYRLAYWRVAADEINYRRFFDINDLAGLRVEDAEVLARTHELVFAMIADARIGGLRIDHVDGLANPGGYVNLLVDRAAALGQPLYLVVEKILLGEERLRPSWRIAGTTGYDFMNLVLGLFVDRAAERGFDRLYERATGRTATFVEEAYEAKRRVMRIDLASELGVLADALTRIAHQDRHSSDFTNIALRRALVEVVAAFPVYRTYVVDDAPESDDRAVIDAAIAHAAERSELPDPAVFDFIRDALGAQLARVAQAHYDRVDGLHFAMRFQQYTGPVTAKSLEDTAFYRYVRLVALNEVGGEPARFGRSVDEFHAANADRARTHPGAMLATATHDHKRGEDTRLRIAALTEFPAEWSRAIARWARMNAGARDAAGNAPLSIDELLFYQSIIGTLPPAWLGNDGLETGALAEYIERIVAYMQKAAREAKLRTSWTDPNASYEEATEAFVRTALAAESPFLRDARSFTTTVAAVAAVHGLAQVTLKIASPGVPDIYQGCELWDFSLVDPDNRRPVDYSRRSEHLAAFAADRNAAALLAGLLDSWPDGRIKLYVTWKLLHLRRTRPQTFGGPSYHPLRVAGDVPDAVVAFARDDIVVVAPRLVRRRIQPGEIRITGNGAVMTGRPAGRFRNLFDDRLIAAGPDGGLDLDEVFASAPVAVLLPADS